MSQSVVESSIDEIERCLGLSWLQRQQTCIRIDAGFGTDAKLEWLLKHEYQVIAKSHSGTRAGIWGKHITDWIELDPDRRWVALSPQQLSFCRPTRTIAVRWRGKKDKLKHALYVVTDMATPIAKMVKQYDLRGGLEVDIREDKQALLLTHRRKRRWHAQETLVLLNDLAHNFLVMFRREFLAQTSVSHFGLYRLIHDVIAIPGQARLDNDGYLVELRLLQSHPYASVVAQALQKLWS